MEEAPSQYSGANRDIVAGQHAESDSSAAPWYTRANRNIVATQYPHSESAQYTRANRDADACEHSNP